MRAKLIILIPSMLLSGCDEPTVSAPETLPAGSASLTIDDTSLFVPIAWNALRLTAPRPWPNGLRIDSGGWGHFEPQSGPISLLAPGQAYRSDSTGQQKRLGNPDPFFSLSATFEFPESPRPANWWQGVRQAPTYPFNVDLMTLSYRTPTEEVKRPYIELLSGISPKDGDDVGDGWRQVQRQFDRREIKLRFDARDWRTRGGRLPRRIAASFNPSSWSHFVALDRPRWTAQFQTEKLPVGQWRARYVTVEELFAWLQTPPGKRDEARRFRWWADLEFRPRK